MHIAGQASRQVGPHKIIKVASNSLPWGIVPVIEGDLWRLKVVGWHDAKGLDLARLQSIRGCRLVGKSSHLGELVPLAHVRVDPGGEDASVIHVTQGPLVSAANGDGNAGGHDHNDEQRHTQRTQPKRPAANRFEILVFSDQPELTHRPPPYLLPVPPR